MSLRGAAWRHLVLAWVPAVLFLAVNVGMLVWQTSAGHGREARLREAVADLQAKADQLGRIKNSAHEQVSDVAVLQEQMATLYNDAFGSLEARLTGILRAVGQATREAGLMPQAYGYDANKDGKLGLIQFGITFNVKGDYSQIRTMLAALQTSPEILTVDRISFSGEEGVTSRDIAISVHATTYLAQADPALLERLVAPGGKNAATSTPAPAPTPADLTEGAQ